ncbi:MAG: Uncharacterized protein G01um101491_379 [Parcubacteria group bacterium Gr01-1014_91]|nr:MAG: Uncharacterized protein G01um101491_379 [Parcubacteria group bacterium Gr01-1014_91]
MAYVVGFFAADGYISLNNRGAHFWNIQITDKELLDNIKRTVQSDHKIGIRKRNLKESTIYRLQIGSIEMCNDLRKLGFTERKSKNLSVNKVPKKYFSHFARGYFDGDGNVWVGFAHKDRKTPSLTLLTAFTSCSTDFLRLLLKELNKHGIEGGSIYVSKENYSRLQLGTRDSLKLYDLMYNQDNSSGLRLLRKKVVFEKFQIKRKNAVVV